MKNKKKNKQTNKQNKTKKTPPVFQKPADEKYVFNSAQLNLDTVHPFIEFPILGIECTAI